MKTEIVSAAICAFALAHPSCANTEDPTVPSNAMADRLRTSMAGSEDFALLALVVGPDGDGVALLGRDAAGGRIVRRDSAFTGTAGGVTIDATVASVDERGVILKSDSGEPGISIPASYRPLRGGHGAPAGRLRYLEANGVPLGMLLRLVSDQSGENISASEATAGKKVSIFLRNVTAETAVEEICRASSLWYRRDPDRGITRVVAMDEYAGNLNTFREETTEMFTLLYPNVTEVAAAIFGLYPDRTFLSLGEEEIEDDAENDLSRRFRRFRVLEDNGGAQFLDMTPPNATSSGSRSSSGEFSFARGSIGSRRAQWDQALGRNRGGSVRDTPAISADDAKLIELAYSTGNTNLLDMVRGQVAASSASIFVTMSRKNNVLIVRTGDSRVMNEIRALVKRLDVPVPMVLMEVKVMELDIDDDYEASFQYSFNRQSQSLGNSGRTEGGLVQTAMDAFDPTMAFTVLNKNIEAQMRLSQKDGKIRTLATPVLLVANNEVSRIFSGKEYPLVTGWKQGDTVVSDSGIVQGSTTVQIEKKDVGTMLLITPNINADKTVTLRILQENSEVSPEKVDIPVDGGSGETKSIEFVESRQLAGTFVAKDGMAVMAGGLVRERESEVYWRTPVLGSIPLVGWLFRGTEKVKKRTELIVTIKPHVISTPMEGGKISQELLDALSAHPAADGRDTMGIHKPDAPHTADNDVKNVTE